MCRRWKESSLFKIRRKEDPGQQLVYGLQTSERGDCCALIY